MTLSIIIVNYKTKNLIRYQLQRLFENPPQIEFEVIVVDNNSADGIAEMIAHDFPQVHCVEAPENRGYAAGNNLGIGQAQGKYILIINPDIVMQKPQSIEKLVAFMDNTPQCGLAVPKLLYPNGELQESCSRWPSFLLPFYRRTFFNSTTKGKQWLDHYFYREWDHTTNRKIDWAIGAAFLVRKEYLVTVGLMDQSFFLYFEDTDWCRRFWQAGYEVWYVADAELTHYHKRESADNGLIGSMLNRSSREHLKSFFKYFKKYWGQRLPHNE